MAVCISPCTSISDIQAYIKIDLSEQILYKLQLTCFETWVYFQLQSFSNSNSLAVPVKFETLARLRRVSWKQTKLDSMATFWAKIPYRNIV